MSIALIRKQNIFGILLSSNTLLKTSLDKGCYQKLLSLGDDRRQAHKNSDKQIPQIAWRHQSRDNSLSWWICVQTVDRKASKILDYLQATTEAQTEKKCHY